MSTPLILLAGLFFHQTVCAETTNLLDYFMRVWQTQDGLPNNAVTAIVQTQNGYLWLATYDGLVRFDGVTFTVFDNSNTPQMHSSRITSLFEDSTGNLWIGCESGDLIRYREGQFFSVSFHPKWENKKILSIGANARGRIRLMNGDGKLADLDGRTVAVPNASRAVSVIVMAQTPEVVESYHLQVWPWENVRQLLADGFEDADSREFLDALGKHFLLALGLLLRRALNPGI